MQIGIGCLNPSEFFVKDEQEKREYLKSDNLLVWLSKKIMINGEDANVDWYGVKLGDIDGEDVYLYNNIKECIMAAFQHPLWLCGWIYYGNELGWYILVMKATDNRSSVEYKYFINQKGQCFLPDEEGKVVNIVINKSGGEIIDMQKE